jgi:hypothetical protein
MVQDETYPMECDATGASLLEQLCETREACCAWQVVHVAKHRLHPLPAGMPVHAGGHELSWAAVMQADSSVADRLLHRVVQ